MGGVGGNPTTIGGAATQLLSCATSVADRPHGIDSATAQGEAGVGHPDLGSALGRFGAAYSQFSTDVGAELKALGTLAESAAADLNKAGGEH